MHCDILATIYMAALTVKGEEQSTATHGARSKKRELKMISGSSYIPREKLGALQGDDAHFSCAEMETIGVADGVGGRSKHGVDAGEYARQLMSNAEYAAVNGDPDSKLDSRKVLNDAYSKTKVKGSSTACILTLDQDQVTTLPVEVGASLLLELMGCLIIEELVRTQIEGGSDPQDVAWAVARQANCTSMDREVFTPFTEGSLDAGKSSIGGNEDDITPL